MDYSWFHVELLSFCSEITVSQLNIHPSFNSIQLRCMEVTTYTSECKPLIISVIEHNQQRRLHKILSEKQILILIKSVVYEAVCVNDYNYNEVFTFLISTE